MAATSSLFMYSLTLQPPSSVTQAILGQFAGTKEQQILTASGSRITLQRPGTVSRKFTPILSHDVFGIIRSIASFRLAGSKKDYIIIGSDSGRISVIEYMPDSNQFERRHLETFGKSGVRRVVPGQYLSVDPKGRACMIASVEKNKIAYVLNRNAQAEFVISSPLEANKPSTIVFSMCALDVGYENPVFAALEIDYSESDLDSTGIAYEEIEKQLVYYELDLGLNHVVRKWAEPVDRTAHSLYQVPGGNDGPGGVLVCSEDNVTYRHSTQEAVRVPIPRRRGATEDPNRKRHIVCGVTHKLRGAFFSLLQTEDGDLFKVTLDLAENSDGASTGEVERLKIKYFDTVPVATSLLILKSGYLFLAAESGDHECYQIIALGDDDDESEFASDQYPQDPAEWQPAYFHPRSAVNIDLLETIQSQNPQTKTLAANLTAEDAPQIYSICGQGARSSLKTLRHGLEVSEVAESDLPPGATAVWTLKLNKDDEYDTYIVLSFLNATLVLGIGETVEEVADSGFSTAVPTLAVQLLGDDALVQIHPRGIRCISKERRTVEWAAPQHRTIVAAATNQRQIAIALSSGEIIYFELGPTGELDEYEGEKVEMSGTVTCMSLGDVPEGRQRSSFLAVGCDDSTVRILSLDPDTTLENKSVQALTAAPSALNILSMDDGISGGSTLYLHIGLYSGIHLRTVLDEITGELSDTRSLFLGAKPVKLFRTKLQGQPAMLALSSRAWLGYLNHQSRAFMLTPLSYVPLEWGCSFQSMQCPEGMVGLQGDKLRIFYIEQLINNLLSESIPLAHTPRNFVRHPEHSLFYVMEADNHTLSTATQDRLRGDPGIVNGDAAILPPEKFGYPPGREHWASCIEVVDPITEKKVLSTIELEENEAATAIAAVPFESQESETFLVVATGKDMIVSPRSHNGGFIHIFRFLNSGQELEFIHKTRTEEPCLALLAFQGRLLAGVGADLRLFDLGMKQLLRKAQIPRCVSNIIVGLQTQGSRIAVSDVTESVTYVVYKFGDNKLLRFADDSIARWTTATSMVDYETVAGGDKFGNLWLLRCPAQASEEADEEGAANHLVHEKGYLQGSATRLNCVAHFYTQDIPTTVQKTSLLAGGREVLLWGGLQGTLGALIPIESRGDVNFFQTLEQHLRQEDTALTGRDHLIYRGYYVPAKGVIDGDLCERFTLLPTEKKLMIAAEMDKGVREVERKIGEARSKVVF